MIRPLIRQKVRWLTGLAVLLLTHGIMIGQAAGVIVEPEPYGACNSDADDYAPIVDVDGASIVFTSERSGIAQIYQCRGQEAPQRISGSLNQSGEACAFASFRPDGEGFAAVYASHHDQSYASIVAITRSKASLDRGLPLVTTNGRFFTSHPSISPDGTRLVYVSDRPGGSGGLDLWMIERQLDGTWSVPSLVAEALSSPGDEITPVLIASDTLLFASDGMGGRGGFDVYQTVYRNGRWDDPVPIDAINTAYDESDARTLPDGSMIYATNRPGGQGGLDLWVWKQGP
ncbi:MAG: hypothetical protein RL594_998 [Bacteroidota bacterium]|jgi:Tol biopolymer transport system component